MASYPEADYALLGAHSLGPVSHSPLQGPRALQFVKGDELRWSPAAEGSSATGGAFLWEVATSSIWDKENSHVLFRASLYTY